MDYILALDQGTTSSRAIIFDRQGRICTSAQMEFAQIFPKPGWVEHDPMAIWNSQLEVAQNAVQALRSRDPLARIAALGITNQRETTVLWDRKSGKPVANAIVWQDRRTAVRCDQLRAKGREPFLQHKTGLLADAYFSASKLEWLLDNVPDARVRAEAGELAFGTVDSWLIFNLTGGRLHVTDFSNASRTMLLDIHSLKWDRQLLRLFNIPEAVLPKLVASSEVLGETDTHLLGQAIPIAGVAGDQQAATFGQACYRPGEAKNTYGTGCFMLMNTGTSAVPSRSRLLTTVAWKGPDEKACYALEGSVFMGGATVQWLRDGLQIIQSAEEITSLASSVADSGDAYLVPAFVGLGAPYWDGHARGSLIGLTRGTTRAHIARAALEAIALQSADVFEAMANDSAIALRELRVDGGASRNDLLMQLQSDYLGVPVVRPKIVETTALGAAYLAGLSSGFWSGIDEISQQRAVDKRFEPNMSEAQRMQKRARWSEAVQRSRNWAN